MRIDPALKAKIKRRVVEELRAPKKRQVIVKTPYKLSDAQLARMKKAMPGLSDAVLVNKIDSALIAGLVIVDGSLIVDYSLKGKMNEVVEHLLQS